MNQNKPDDAAQDPAEGSRETVERQLEKEGKGPKPTPDREEEAKD
jgi:hypothetical protein